MHNLLIFFKLSYTHLCIYKLLLYIYIQVTTIYAYADICRHCEEAIFLNFNNLTDVSIKYGDNPHFLLIYMEDQQVRFPLPIHI